MLTQSCSARWHQLVTMSEITGIHVIQKEDLIVINKNIEIHTAHTIVS